MKTLGKIIVIVFCFVLLFVPSALATRVKEQVIRQEDYGDRWAFTVALPHLLCQTSPEALLGKDFSQATDFSA